jgi:hypothetical protein
VRQSPGGLQRVGAGIEVEDDVVARAVGGGLGDNVRRHIDEAYSGANDHCIGRIANGAADDGLRSLGVSGNRANRQKDQAERNTAQTAPQFSCNPAMAIQPTVSVYCGRQTHRSFFHFFASSILDKVDLALGTPSFHRSQRSPKFIAVTLTHT